MNKKTTKPCYNTNIKERMNQVKLKTKKQKTYLQTHARTKSRIHSKKYIQTIISPTNVLSKTNSFKKQICFLKVHYLLLVIKHKNMAKNAHETKKHNQNSTITHSQKKTMKHNKSDKRNTHKK